jgi:hypothetical protein
MKKRLFVTGIIICALAVSFLGACTATVNASDGKIQVYVTDAPSENVTAIEIKVSTIEVHKAGAGEGEWITLLENPPIFDLLKVAGIDSLLGTANVTSGNYTQVRLGITSVMVTINGENKTATVPSDKLKFVGNFTVEAGKTTAIGFDFDAAKSIVIKGNGEVSLKPVVKLITGKPGKGLETTTETTDNTASGNEKTTVLNNNTADNATTHGKKPK